MRRPARAAGLAVALLLVPLATRRARAQDTPVQTQVDGNVDLSFVGGDDDQLRDSIRELLSRLHLVLTPRDANVPPSSRVASVQIDLSSPADALLVVTDAATGEVRLRRSIPRNGSANIVREEIAHAVQSAVEAATLAARERAAAPPTPPPAPPPAPIIVVAPPALPVKEEPRAPAPPARYGLELATLAGVGPIASGAGPDSRIGLGGTLVTRGPLHPSLAVSALFAVPFDTDTTVTSAQGESLQISTQTTIVSARAMPGVGLVRGSWFALDLAAGGGFDVVTVSPHSTNLPSSALDPQSTRVDALLSAMLTAHAGVAPGVVFLLSAGIDVDLASRQYVLVDGVATTDVFDPWRVRPMILAGFGFTALGDGFFPSGAGK
jgi:hypothetical protein